jgi:hypothetical protein
MEAAAVKKPRKKLSEHLAELVCSWSQEYLEEAQHDGTAMCIVAQMHLNPKGFGHLTGSREEAFKWLQLARKLKNDTRSNVQALQLLDQFFPETLSEKEQQYLEKYFPNNRADFDEDLNILERETFLREWAEVDLQRSESPSSALSAESAGAEASASDPFKDSAGAAAAASDPFKG